MGRKVGNQASWDTHCPNHVRRQGVASRVSVPGKPFATAVQPVGSRGGSGATNCFTFVVLPKRWVVERSFAWLEKCRRLWKNCERKLNTSLQMVVLAFTVLS